jgi:hypothetical protein
MQNISATVNFRNNDLTQTAINIKCDKLAEAVLEVQLPVVSVDW